MSFINDFRSSVREFSGRLRNLDALCRELGVRPLTDRRSAEEAVLVSAYKKWGDAVGAHLRGAFAFALWDEEERKLTCVRDPFGTKPFYYYEAPDGKFLCSASLNRILNHPSFVKELNLPMLQLYLTFTYVPGEDTFFKGVKKLLPGRALTRQDGRTRIYRYWKPEFRPDESKSLNDWAEEIHETVKAIMPEMKTPDEKAVCFLSSGVDSSYVFALSDADTAISCGYAEKSLDKSELARQTAALLGRQSVVYRVTPEAYFGSIPYVM